MKERSINMSRYSLSAEIQFNPESRYGYSFYRSKDERAYVNIEIKLWRFELIIIFIEW